MAILTDRKVSWPAQQAQYSAWKSLEIFNLYRLIVVAGVFMLYLTGAYTHYLDVQNIPLYASTVYTFLFLTLANTLTIRIQKPQLKTQILLQFSVDIVAIMLLMRASVTQGIGLLLIISIAGAALLLSRRHALVLASIATLAILGQQVYNVLLENAPAKEFTQTGFFCLIIFTTAALVNALALRLKTTEDLAEKRRQEFAKLARLNGKIVDYMKSGIIAVDKQLRVQHINKAGLQMLGAIEHRQFQPLSLTSNKLYEKLQAWLKNQQTPAKPFRATHAGPDIKAQFISLDQDHYQDILIILENMAELTQQAQNLKIAALERLTASIAHEIRNPLGAISHAAQLLKESPAIDRQDLRLIQIVLDHSERMNRIIKDTLSLARQQQATPRRIQLSVWLDELKAQYAMKENIPNAIELSIEPDDLVIYADQSQLYQIMSNLWDNALRYSYQQIQQRRILINARVDLDTNFTYIDIIDWGPGIKAAKAKSIFTPFFTTEKDGTGLGLYIARELCKTNQARLDYFPAKTGGSRFRITFLRSVEIPIL